MRILQKPPPVHQALTAAIADAEQRGEHTEVDALLMAKTILIRREAEGGHPELLEGSHV